MEEIPVSLSQQQLWLVMKRSCPKSFLPATAFSLWKERSGEWSQWPWRAHMYAPGGEKYTHISSSSLKLYLDMHTLTWKWARQSLVRWMCNVCTVTYYSLHTDAHTQRDKCISHTHTDGNSTNTWLALKHCSVCIPLPLPTHPPHSHKAAIKSQKTKTQKRG